MGLDTKKRVFVLGATGNVGRLVMSQLKNITDVHQTVYVRNANKLSKNEKNLTVVEGDVLDTNALNKAMKNQEIVIATLSGDLLEQAKSIVRAVQGTTVPRIIWITGLGIHREVPGEIGEILDSLLSQYPEYAQAADTISNSGVAYTLVRAANLVDGDNMEYNLTNEGEEIRSNSVTRNAVAKFIADMVIDNSGLGINKSLGITN